MKQKFFSLRLGNTIGIFLVLSILAAVVVGFLVLYALSLGLPDVLKLKEFRHANSTEVFSSDKKLIGEFTRERRYRIKYEQVPKFLAQAFIAAEDSNFYDHSGVDPRGIARAMLTNIKAGRYKQGASTITQQVARIILLESRKKKLVRKIREALLAFDMEKKLSKQEILSLYMNEIYLGHGSYGIEAAARNYFDKHVTDLTLSEAAILAGLPQRPAAWDPFRNPTACKNRQKYVLRRMFDEGFITKEQAEEAYQEEVRLYSLQKLYRNAPYFTEYVRTFLLRQYKNENVLTKGYKIYTTVNVDYQKHAEQALFKGLREVDKRVGWRGPLEQITDDEEQLKFLKKAHKEAISLVNPVRILKPEVENGEVLDYDYQSLKQNPNILLGDTPLKKQEYYQALVTTVTQNQVEAKVGHQTVLISQKGNEWVKIDNRPVKSLSMILKVGDVIEVKVLGENKELRRIMASLEQPPEVQGALLSYEIKTGRVLAMVGGTDFRKSQFNRALQAKRQVGSTFKPLVYAAAIDKGFSPSSLVLDAPVVFKQKETDLDNQEEERKDWKPRNYGGKFRGEVPLRTALIRSMNIPSIKLLHEIGIDYAVKYVRQLGITSPLPRDLTIALGSWSTSLEELMRAYAIFPRLGKPVELTYIDRIRDTWGNPLEFSGPTPIPEKSILSEEEQRMFDERPDELITPQTAYVMSDLLRAVINEGTGRRAAYVPGHKAGKTGTSNDFFDAWFIGYTPKVMTGVWVGYDTQKPLAYGEGGGRAAAPIWAEYMNYVSAESKEDRFLVPDGVEFVEVDKNTGLPSTENTSERVTIAFHADKVPNENGDNIPSVGEPGQKRTDPKGIKAVATPSRKETEDISDLIRDAF